MSHILVRGDGGASTNAHAADRVSDRLIFKLSSPTVDLQIGVEKIEESGLDPIHDFLLVNRAEGHHEFVPLIEFQEQRTHGYCIEQGSPFKPIIVLHTEGQLRACWKSL